MRYRLGVTCCNQTAICLQFTMLVIVLMTIAVCGCATGGKSFNEMSPKERVTYMYSVYNSQYADYMSMTGHVLDSGNNWVKTSDPELTSDQRSILKSRKEVLVKLYPLIRLYNAQAMSGKAVSRETERQIMDLLNQL